MCQFSICSVTCLCGCLSAFLSFYLTFICLSSVCMSVDLANSCLVVFLSICLFKKHNKDFCLRKLMSIYKVPFVLGPLNASKPIFKLFLSMVALHKLILFPTGQGHHKEAMEQLGYKARVLEALKTDATTLSHQNQSM